MTRAKYFLFLLLQWLVLAFVKVWFFNNQLFANYGIQQIVFWLLLPAIALIFVRRFGFINYLEAFFLIVTWTLADALLDLIFTSRYTGLSIFWSLTYWVGFFTMDLGILLLHKKRHIGIRTGEFHEHGH